MYETEYLEHHGVKGMKWGVRRYRNYDGSYVRKGVKNFDESAKKYDEADAKYKKEKKAYKEAKKSGNKNVSKKELVEARGKRKDAKIKMNRDYNQLKRDKKADKGKRLYQSGKTITGSGAALGRATSIATGTGTVAFLLYQNGMKKPAAYAAAAGLGMEAVNALWGVKNEMDARNLRAYYAHSRK